MPTGNWKRPLALASGVMVGGLITGAVAVAAATEEESIQACVNIKNGLARIVDDSLQCRSSERALVWAVQGPTGPEGPAGPEGPEGPAGEGVAGWARVELDGSLSRGSNVASSRRISTGDYLVSFDFDVSKCSYQATNENVGSNFIGVIPASNDANAVRVGIHNSQAEPRNLFFHIMVVC